MRELVDKQPGLKAGLREFVLKKAGNKARVGGLLDIFAENDADATATKERETPPPNPDAMIVDGTDGTETPPPA